MFGKLIAFIRQMGTAVMDNGVRAPAAFVGKVVELHKGVRRFLVVWAVGLITWVTIHVFKQPNVITTEETVAYATNVGILATILGLYQVSRGRDDGRS